MLARERFLLPFGAMALACTLLASAPCAAQNVTLFAAISLSDALGQALRGYDPGTGARVTTSYAASSALARQIERGAPADVFISADQDWMDALAKAGRIAAGTRTVLLGNRLVLVGASKSTVKVDIVPGFPLARLLGESRLAMGDPMHVPAGRYGKAALVSLGVWDTVVAKIAAAENVRAAVNFVARGEAALGIAYATDVVNTPVRIVGAFPVGSHPPIEYPAAVVATSKQPDAARKLLAYLRSEQAGKVFVRYGFTLGR